MSTRRKGFTLIELLVVIAIIAILAAILFPVFARAKAKAQETQCLSNVKQLATAILTYCSDYDQVPPLQFSGDASSTADADVSDVWETMLPYIKSEDILRCPVAPDAVDLSSIGLSHSSYAVNGSQVSSPDSAFKPDGYFGWQATNLHPDAVESSSFFRLPLFEYLTDMANNDPNTYNTLPRDKSRSPAETYMLWDAELFYEGTCTLDALSSVDVSHMPTWEYTYSQSWGATYLCDARMTEARGNAGCVHIHPAARHNDGLSAAFFDGHAKRQSVDEMENFDTYGGYCVWYFD